MNDQNLLSSYKKTIKLNLHKDFIGSLEKEIQRIRLPYFVLVRKK
ncbi:sporulation histidine kinase inhibitor Sda (plasmid) [Priestia megaterium]|nr:sporulation histidine kinase inhibitor Sda [Priestia megaterium]MDH2449680.1 sporulation histidine kinase inhibitor Sda [Priestia megaterium]MDL5149138.1 sporulation histidine kinase inhibitor Sda [Priestia megaterium]MDW4512116.1 sporulation histidine kinase inhibitor Sda [Priestia megaterium]PEC41630.1 hypothetical protein CON11_27685 [Priestia megaterium]PER65298.1 hypothetical protein CN492_27890 [Priestia megaterium]